MPLSRVITFSNELRAVDLRLMRRPSEPSSSSSTIPVMVSRPQPGLGHGLDLHGRALIAAHDGQPMHHTDAVARVGMLVGPGGIVAGVDHPLHILRADVGAVLHLREARAHLYDIYRISPAGSEAPYHARVLRVMVKPARSAEWNAISAISSGSSARKKTSMQRLRSAGEISCGCAWSRPPVGNPPGDRF